MPFALVLALLDVILVVHAAKTGRFHPWAYVIILLPGLGAIAYVVAELAPAWFGSADGQRVRQRVVDKLDPERAYRDLTDRLAIADTVANRSSLAAECLELGKYSEAEDHYGQILERPLGDEPIYALGKARAQFGRGRAPDAIETLDDMRTRWPAVESAEGHLLYARALAQGGRTEEALEEFQSVSQYFPGAEARVRHGLLLNELGRAGEAKVVFAELLIQMRRAPKYVRKVQAEWLAIAERHIAA